MEIKVNMTNCEKVLEGGYPLRIWAVCSIEAPDGDGLPLDAEYEMLLDAEAELLGRISDNGTTLYLGHMLHQGSHVTVMHSQAQGELAEGARRLQCGRGWNIYTANDPESKFLRLSMMPRRAELRRLRDTEVLQALASANDNAVVPRMLTFYALFPQKEGAEQAAVELDRHDFAASPPSRMPGNSDYPWSLMFSCMASTEPDVIEQISNLADDVCAHYGGLYDGWSADPIP